MDMKLLFKFVEAFYMYTLMTKVSHFELLPFDNLLTVRDIVTHLAQCFPNFIWPWNHFPLKKSAKPLKTFLHVKLDNYTTN
jgi:hypothetical protein